MSLLDARAAEIKSLRIGLPRSLYSVTSPAGHSREPPVGDIHQKILYRPKVPHLGIGDAIRLIVIGDTGVGKTQMMLRYTDNTFSTDSISTIGIDFKTKGIQHPGRSTIFFFHLVANLVEA
jgi:hypothetical protein